ELFHGVGSAGFHVHFANNDRNFGGHVLDFEIEDAKVEIQNFETFEQQDEIFNKTDIDYKDIAEEIREAE
uniref:acetolactate decarboxylase n=1 Tax=Staphylococcus warneri TaxID=1292 RepID=UPI0022E840A2